VQEASQLSREKRTRAIFLFNAGRRPSEGRKKKRPEIKTIQERVVAEGRREFVGSVYHANRSPSGQSETQKKPGKRARETNVIRKIGRNTKGKGGKGPPYSLVEAEARGTLKSYSEANFYRKNGNCIAANLPGLKVEKRILKVRGSVLANEQTSKTNPARSREKRVTGVLVNGATCRRLSRGDYDRKAGKANDVWSRARLMILGTDRIKPKLKRSP